MSSANAVSDICTLKTSAVSWQNQPATSPLHALKPEHRNYLKMAQNNILNQAHLATPNSLLFLWVW